MLFIFAHCFRDNVVASVSSSSLLWCNCVKVFVSFLDKTRLRWSLIKRFCSLLYVSYIQINLYTWDFPLFNIQSTRVCKLSLKSLCYNNYMRYNCYNNYILFAKLTRRPRSIKIYYKQIFPKTFQRKLHQIKQMKYHSNRWIHRDSLWRNIKGIDCQKSKVSHYFSYSLENLSHYASLSCD